MKFSANTYVFRDLDRESVFRSLASIGLSGVEIITHEPCFHVDTLDTKEVRDKTLKLLDELGLEIVAISPHTEFLVFDDDKRRINVEHCMAQIDLALLYGVRLVRIFSGGEVPEGKTWDECTREVLKGMIPCVEYAEKRGVKLAVESHGRFGNNLEQMVKIMDTIQSESLGVTLDTANFHLYGIDPAKAIDVLNRRIFHTHLKDYALKDGEGSIFKRYMGKPVGEGILNFPEIIKKLKEHDYRGAYCFEYGGEYSPEEGIRRGMNYLSKVMEELDS